ncbi:MAG: DEAD/DEAH box helicase family protein, partial [Pseudomonas sp.]|nr:DEAD/DEAH box helicase family protein [Pseudomonas sp.]
MHEGWECYHGATSTWPYQQPSNRKPRVPGPILQVALPSPLRRLFDYRSPAGVRAEDLCIGQRVRVPFGQRQMVGVIAGISDTTEVPAAKLKPAQELIDLQPLFPESLWQLILWTASYYQHGLGDTLGCALPTLLRQGEPAIARQDLLWQLLPGAYPEHPAVSRAAKQKQAVQVLAKHPHGLSHALISQWGLTRDALEALERKGLAQRIHQSPHHTAEPLPLLSDIPLKANAEQQAALEAIASKSGFTAWLLDGVTGSGKTEVYLQAIERCLVAGRQALVLIPEIGLTPQTMERFQKRFSIPVVILHSGLNDRERLDAWVAARDGEAGIIIGTRSAIFTPLARPGLIIVDEEHDLSFKQQ